MGLFRRRREPEADPDEARIAAFRAQHVAGPEPPVSELLQQLEVPFQRKGEAWLVEVGGAWATVAWVPRDATLAGFLEYEEVPGPSPVLVRANADTGLAWYDAGGNGLTTRIALPAEDVDRTGLALALAALRREAGGAEEPPLETPPEARLEQDGTPDDALAGWMLQMSGMRGARLGIDDAATLYAIAAVPARPVSPGGLAWALGEIRALERLYRA